MDHDRRDRDRADSECGRGSSCPVAGARAGGTGGSRRLMISVSSIKRVCLLAMLCLAIFLLLGAGDEDARFNTVGHKMMCVCGCNQVLLECNHVGCRYSDRMRGELSSALSRAESDDLVLQSFVQEYGPTVLIAP